MNPYDPPRGTPIEDWPWRTIAKTGVLIGWNVFCVGGSAWLFGVVLVNVTAWMAQYGDSFEERSSDECF